MTLSYSSIKEFAKSPAHYLAYKARKNVESAAMRFGSAVHMAILEPKKYLNEYVVCEHRKNTIKFREFEAECLSKNPDMKFLTPSDAYAIEQIKERISENELVTSLLQCAPEREQFVEGTINGLTFVGYVDALAPEYFVDIKTTKDSHPDAFTRSAFNFSYHLQGAIYRELTGVSDFWILAIENNNPFTITPYLVSQDYLDRGLAELSLLIEEFKKWDGMSRGYGFTKEGYFDLDAPSWA